MPIGEAIPSYANSVIAPRLPTHSLGENLVNHYQKNYRRSGSNRHSLREPDFESGASANSATPARELR